MIDKYPEIEALNKPAKKLLVFLHGVGSDGNDLIELVPVMQNDLPSVHFISPHGIQEYELAPYGRQWFSLYDRSIPFLQKEVNKAIPILREFLDNKLRELDLTYEDLILVGFSQGTMLSLGLSFHVKVGCIVGFSGVVIPEDAQKEGVRNNICLIYGADDEVINVEYMRETSKYLKKLCPGTESHEIPNLSHSINTKGIDIAKQFIIKNI